MHPSQEDLYIIADGIVWDPQKNLERKRSTRWASIRVTVRYKWSC